MHSIARPRARRNECRDLSRSGNGRDVQVTI